MLSTRQMKTTDALKPLAQELRQLAQLFEVYAREEDHFSSSEFQLRVSEQTKQLSLLIRQGTKPVQVAGEIIRTPEGRLCIEDTSFYLTAGQHLEYWSHLEGRHVPSRLAYSHRLFLVDRPHLKLEGLHVLIRESLIPR